MLRIVPLSILLLWNFAWLFAESQPQLRLTAPVRIRVGDSLKLTFEVRNVGEDGFYFKVPWKWAANGLRVIATATDGRVHTSSTVLYDIAAESVCTNFKAVGPHESFQFERSLLVTNQRRKSGCQRERICFGGPTRWRTTTMRTSARPAAGTFGRATPNRHRCGLRSRRRRPPNTACSRRRSRMLVRRG